MVRKPHFAAESRGEAIPDKGAATRAWRRRSLARIAMTLHMLILGRAAAAQTQLPQIVRWEIEATVTDMADPDGVFPDVRLGDAVRGTLTYDVNNNYSYPVWLGLASMTIENPRTGRDLSLVKDVHADAAADIFWFDAHPDETKDDQLEIYQSVTPPIGFRGEAPIVTAFFAGPTSVIAGGSPLVDLDLADWPVALLQFYDFYDIDAPTYIDAEISSMTLVTAPLAVADFDYDGDVDGNDLYGWEHPWNQSRSVYADADHDGDSDGADFLAWQRQLGPATNPLTTGLAKYDAFGNLLWSRQVGTASSDATYSKAVDGLGSPYISGVTEGKLGGPNAGSGDAFLIKFAVPEPSMLPLVVAAAIAATRRGDRTYQRPTAVRGFKCVGGHNGT